MTENRADELPETSELVAMVAVVEAGSVSGGARRLRVPRATVSRRLARLEERLGVRLMHRTPRRLSLTEAGLDLYTHAREIVGSVERASRSVRLDDREPSGLLRVSVPPSSDQGFREMLVDFVRRFPRVNLEVIHTTRHADLVAQRIDVAWRAGPITDQSLIARRLSSGRQVAVATREYLDRRGRPHSASELQDHDCLVGFAQGELPMTHWPLMDGGQVRVHTAMASNDPRLLLTAARAGLGIALAPARVAESLAQSTPFETVLPGVVGERFDLAVVYAEKHLQKPALRAFVDHSVSWWTSRAGTATTG